MPPSVEVQKSIDNLSDLLSRNQFKSIISEIAKYKRRPNWYTLFGGPANIQQLAYHLKRHVHYDFLYRQWSNVAHAHDFSPFIAVTSTGEGGIRGIRNPEPIKEVSRFAATFMIDATILMLQEFRPGETYSTYYEREVRPLFLRILKR